MSSSDENHPDSAPGQTAQSPLPPPLSESARSDALVATRPTLPDLPGHTVAGRAAPPEILRAQPKPLELLLALQRRWLLAVCVAVLLAIPAAAYAFFTTPVTYRAESWLRARKSYFLYNVDKGDYPWGAHVQLIKSFFVMNAVLSLPEIAELPWIQEVERSGGEPADWLASKISVSLPSRGSFMVRIGMSGEDPEQLQKLVAAVTDAYLDRVVNEEKKDGLKRRDMLEQVYFKKYAELEKLRGDIRSLQIELGSRNETAESFQQKFLANTLYNLKDQIGKYRRANFFADYELKLFEEQYGWNGNSSQVPPDLIETIIAKDETLEQLDEAGFVLSEQLRQLKRVIRNPDSPRIREKQFATRQLQKEKEAYIASLRADLEAKIRTGQIRTELQREHDRLKRRVVQTAKIYEDFTEEFFKLQKEVKIFSQYSADLARKKGDQKFLSTTVGKLGSELEALQFELSLGIEKLELVQKARQPRTRNTKGRDKKMLMATFAAIGLAFGGTALFEFFHRRVTSGQEMAEGLGIPVLGNVPMLSAHRWNFRRSSNGTSADNLQGIMDESVDGIRAMLLHSRAGESVRTLLVTSAKAGEGKTTVASALAASMGRSGRRTLLVDGDLRRPSVHRLLDMPIDEGFAEVLRGEASVEDVIRPSRAAGLWFMSAGQCDHVALQGLTKEGVGDLFEKLRTEFDFVVIDSGPTMTVVDPLLLGQHCDAAIVTVVRRVSQLTTVYETNERLKTTGIQVIGCVINGLQGSPFMPGYYAYGYGYGYGNGYGNGHKDSENAQPNGQ